MPPKTETVIICPYCKGWGTVTDSEQCGPTTNVKEKTCPRCNGTGRQIKIETTQYKTFNQKESC